MKGRAQETKESIRKYRMKKIHLFAVIFLVFLVAISLNGFATHPHIAPVDPVMILPFILLLLGIAVMPFISSRWWMHNYPKVSLGLAAVAVIYYFLVLKNGPRMIHSGLEYFSFIALIGSLFVVSGGIHVKIKGRATPLSNTILLGLGAVVANILGTTGASMILIRPFIRVNKYRISGYHIVFFIFIVSNLGGMLTPVGDPPLFLGYLRGIPFFWLLTRIWPIWALVVTVVLAIFYLIDHHNYKKLPDSLEHEIEEKGEEVSVSSHGNYVFLAVILGAVFLPRPIREIVMLCTAIASCLTTHIDVHDKNEFNFAPIKEVAILFAGIFATMTPAMDWLELNAPKLGITQPGSFYWGSGILSSFLDNAPTYLNFLSAAAGLHGLNLDNSAHVKALLGLIPPGDVKGSVETGLCVLTATSWRYVLAISAGAVMFGAMTYIGNGPNFMVKSIAEQSRVRMPSFFGYMIKYSIPILLPIFAVIWYFFFY